MNRSKSWPTSAESIAWSDENATTSPVASSAGPSAHLPPRLRGPAGAAHSNHAPRARVVQVDVRHEVQIGQMGRASGRADQIGGFRDERHEPPVRGKRGRWLAPPAAPPRALRLTSVVWLV